jgi:hypothetical protein
MAAEDEIRGNFPLSSIFMDPNDKDSMWPWVRRKYQDPQRFKGVMTETWYPGAHSDVGGGYMQVAGEAGRPEQRIPYVDEFGMQREVVIPAKAPVPPKRPDLSLIPLRDMHRASVRAQVPMSALSHTTGPDDMERWCAAYDSFRSGKPYAIGKQYIQTFQPIPYIMLYTERERTEAITNLKIHFIHDSRWPHDKILMRRQRTVLYMGPQPSGQ